MADIQKTLQTLSDEYSKLQTGNLLPLASPFRSFPLNPPATELQSTIDARQKLESQHQENKGVAREFSFFASENEQEGGAGKIYKVVGPVLLAQDKSEAIMAVQARLEFIEKEMYVLLFLPFPFLFFLHNEDDDDDDEDQQALLLLLAGSSTSLFTKGGRGGRGGWRREISSLAMRVLIRPLSGGDRIESG